MQAEGLVEIDMRRREVEKVGKDGTAGLGEVVLVCKFAGVMEGDVVVCAGYAGGADTVAAGLAAGHG